MTAKRMTSSKGLKFDQEVTVIAWWNANKPVICKVGSIMDGYLYVRPMVGNPHSRIVKITDIVDPN